VHIVDLFQLFHNVILNFFPYNFISKGQEAHNKNSKAFRDRAREITMAFFSDTRDPKIEHVKASVFGRPRGEPLNRLVDEHPEPALTLPPPVIEGMVPPDLYAR
jgi:hypothetical protein